MRKIIFITGATSGIGEATAKIFAENNYDLIVSGRRNDRLLQIAQKLEETYKINVFILCFDVRNKEEVKEAVASLPEKWTNIDVLVNNAGLAVGLEKIQHGIVEDWETMIDTNIKGLLYVSQAIIPFFIKNQKGHIINLGSTAAKTVYEKGNVYCATKFAVDALSKSMRIDLLEHGIKVTQISPGAAETEFSLVRFKGDKNQAVSAYKGYQPLSANDIAPSIYYVANLPKHICINELEITSLAQANSTYFHKTN